MASSFKVLLIDIEGTVSPISFVKDVLFPYARDNVEAFVRGNLHDEKVQAAISRLAELAGDLPFRRSSDEATIQDAAAIFKHLVAADSKATAFKELQGQVWLKGYHSGMLKAQLFDDVPRALRAIARKRKIYVYSSGSVGAQKLFFGHTSAGDLLGLFADFFDTKVGGKREKASYETIARAIGENAEDVLFLTDVEEEALAAREAGFQVNIVVREGNAPLTQRSDGFTKIRTLDEVVQ